MLAYRNGDVVVLHNKPYQLIKLLGRGGQGAVYEAKDHQDQVVAVKMMPAQERHCNEVRILASMQSDHIVRYIDAGVARGAFIMVMEKVEGVDLKTLVHHARETHRKIPEQLAIEFIVHACLGLLEALQHGKLAFHRDIKPGNLLLERSGLVKLIDFGIAHLDDMAYTGSLIGTPENMAPEQVGLSSEWKVDIRTDLFCLGLVLYELLTLETIHIFPKTMPVPERLLKVWQCELEPQLAKVDALHPALGDFMRKALQRNPAARFQTPLEMIKALSLVRAQLPEAVQLPAFAACMHRVIALDCVDHRLEQMLPSSEGPVQVPPLLPVRGSVQLGPAVATPAQAPLPPDFVVQSPAKPTKQPVMSFLPSALRRRFAAVAAGSAGLALVGWLVLSPATVSTGAGPQARPLTSLLEPVQRALSAK